MPRAELATDGTRINVETEFREKDLIKAVPGARYDATARTWYTPVTWGACKALRGVFGDRLTVGAELTAWAASHLQNVVTPALVLRDTLEYQGANHLPDYLFSFQKAGVEFMRVTRRSLHAGQQRTGKMYQAIAFLQVERAFPALVIAPNSVKRGWLRRLGELAPEVRAVVLEGTAAKRRRQLALVREGEADVAIINWEGLKNLSRLAPYGSVALKRCVDCGGEANVTANSCEAHERDLNLIDWQTVIADEAHRMKNPKAKQTRAAWWLARDATNVFPMTGTPIANHPGDLWSLLHFANPHEHPSRVRYVDRYCLVANNEWGGLDVVGLQPQHAQEFYDVVNPRLIRHLRSVVYPQMPPVVYDTRAVELARKQRVVYDELRDTCVAELEQGTLVAVNALARMTRLSQLACAAGELVDDPSTPDGKKLILSEPSCKVDELLTIIDDLEGEQLVVFAESRQLIELCEARLQKAGIAHASIRGGISEDDRERAEAALASGSIRAILCTLGSGGEGLDFASASTVVFLQRSWSALKNSQAEDRVMAPTQRADNVQIIDVVAVNTVEQHRAELLKEKSFRLEEVVRDQDTLRRLITGE